MKLTLGTVQFGLPYGINNSSGIPLDVEIKKIFLVARNAGIKYLDTAINYGNAEEKIGSLSGGGFNVITKLPAFPENTGYTDSWLNQTIDESLVHLNSKKIYGLLLHRPLQLLEKCGAHFYNGLQQLKENNKVQHIGISIYEPSELDKLIGKFDFDIVQAPFNIFDRRLIETGWMEGLSRRGIQIHVRSVFLQGLLLVLPSKRLSKFKRWAALWSDYDHWIEQSGLSPLEACIRFALSFPEISNVIIGVDHAEHLTKILQASKGEIPLVPDYISSNDIDLLNPLAWLNI